MSTYVSRERSIAGVVANGRIVCHELECNTHESQLHYIHHCSDQHAGRAGGHRVSLLYTPYFTAQRASTGSVGIVECKVSFLFLFFFFFSSRRRHTRFKCDWSSDVCSSDLAFLDRCEAIKFANVEMSPDECRHWADAVRQFLERRAPVT